MRTNCDNCGAVLNAGTCEYCGTVYREDRAVVSDEAELALRVLKQPTIYFTAKAEVDMFDIVSEQFGKSIILNDPLRNAIIVE